VTEDHLKAMDEFFQENSAEAEMFLRLQADDSKRDQLLRWILTKLRDFK